MYGNTLPDHHHYSRYVKKTLVDRDPGTNICLVDADVLAPRIDLNDRPENEISGNHLEYFAEPDINSNLRALFHHLKYVVRFNAKSNGWFVVGQVESLIATAHQQYAEIEVRGDPTPEDQSHAVIVGINPDALALRAALAKIMSAYEISAL